MQSTKPYLLRAIYDWAEENGFTAQVLVNAEIDGVAVPTDHIVDGQIVLNISSGAVKLNVMDNESLNFSARFSGIEQDIFLPMVSILAIFARENSQGIFFEEADDNGTDPEPKLTATSHSKKASTTNINTKRSKSHLKIIK